VALTITLANAIRTVLRKTGLGLYAPNAEITIPSTTTFTWASLFANINLSTHSFEGWLVWRPDSATAGGVDDVRYISSINWTTGVVTVDRAWTDATVGTEDIYILRPPLRPQSLIDAANFAAGKVYFENQEPLSIAVDASFQSSAETAWTEVNTNLTKVTTADSENVYPGMIARPRLSAVQRPRWRTGPHRRSLPCRCRDGLPRALRRDQCGSDWLLS
jgi:hypothetical protein